MGIRGLKTWDDIQSWFAAAGTVSAGSYSAGGAWSLGPSATGDLSHAFRSASELSISRVGSNYPAFAWRHTADGNQWYMQPNGASSNQMEMYYNAVLASIVSTAGAWTFGVVGGTSTHTFNGTKLQIDADNSVSVLTLNDEGAGGKSWDISSRTDGTFRISNNTDVIHSIQASSAGALTLGPAVTGNATGQRHTINGALYGGNVTSTDQSGIVSVGANVRVGASNAQTGRTDTTTGGSGISFSNRTSDTSIAIAFYSNNAGDATSVTASTNGLMRQNSEWSFGRATTAGGALSHTFNLGDAGTLELVDNDASVGTGETLGDIRFISSDADNTSGTAFRIRALSRTSTGASTGFAFNVAITAVEKTLMSSDSQGAISFNDDDLAIIGDPVSFRNGTATASSSNRIVSAQYTVDTDCTGGYFFTCKNSAGTTIGRIEAASNTTTTFTGSSDSRLKTNPTTFNGLDIIMDMVPREFEWISNPGMRTKGFYAQELYEVYPEAVSVGTDEVTESGALATPWGIDYGKLTPVLVKALQELKQQFDDYVAAHP